MPDLYDRKNMPRVIYCIHALSHYLAKKGIAPKIKNLLGSLQFTEDELAGAQRDLDDCRVPMPSFKNVGAAVSQEIQADMEQLKNEAATRIQAAWRGYSTRKRVADLLGSLMSHEQIYVEFQARCRGFLTRQRWTSIREPRNTISSLRKLLPSIDHLDDNEIDFEEEVRLEHLKQQIVKMIRGNNLIDREIRDLDTKIGLLVRNRITLDEIMETTREHYKRLRDSQRDTRQQQQQQQHQQQQLRHLNPNLYLLKPVDKESKARLETYGHLFYLLQTDPRYLARLFRVLNQTKIPAFLEPLVFSLYNYGQSEREEYLLLKLFETMIHEEMSHNESVQEFMTLDAAFIKLTVNYTRSAKGILFLRETLRPKIQTILRKPDLDFDLDPVSIYRKQINQSEMGTGEISRLPYQVSKEEALSYTWVRQMFVERILLLRDTCCEFMQAIVSALNQFPYGIRYIAKCVSTELEHRFPETDRRVILRAVGNIVYYRYVNPAIVAPEVFDIVESVITPVQRKNLAEIAKVLQRAASGNLTESIDEDIIDEMRPLREAITKMHETFSQFLPQLCDVPALEDKFDMDPYKEMTRLDHPIVYLSLGEIYDLHHLLVGESISQLVPAPTSPTSRDALVSILADLGQPPPLNAIQSHDRDQEVALTLINRFAETANRHATDVKELFLETKQLAIVLIRCGADQQQHHHHHHHHRHHHHQQGQTLLTLLSSTVTAQEEEIFRKICAIEEGLHAQGKLSSPLSQTFDRLADVKHRLLNNLNVLERITNGSLVKKADGYQGLMDSLGDHLRHQQRRRVERVVELRKMQKTLESLQHRRDYLENQRNNYRDYIQSCIKSYTATENQKKWHWYQLHPFSRQYGHLKELERQGKIPKYGSFRYTARELFERGVLFELDGVPESQRDQVIFVIHSEEKGLFQIDGSFMGIAVDSIVLSLEDLLEKQFGQVHHLELFGTAKINLNMLIYLINKKFFMN
jgi:hypothetical protein